MASVLAIVSKAIFEKHARVDGRALALGDVWPVAAYNSRHKRLRALAEGGSLFLITVRPPEDAWLVAVLERPEFTGDRWITQVDNVEAARDVTGWLPQLSFDNGKGLNLEPGKLGMSLQTPRVLTDDDVAILRTGGTAVAKRRETRERPTKTQPTAAVTEVPAAASSRLTDALAALRADNPAGALDALLEAWVTHKAAETAVVIERLGALIDRGLPPIPEELKAKRFEAHWLDIAGARRSIDVTRLMAAVGRGSSRGMKRFFGELQDFKPDPRMPWPAMTAVAWYTSSGAGPARTAVVRLAKAVGDGRIPHHPLDLDPDPVLNDLELWREYIESWAERLRASVPAPPPLSADDATVLDAITEQLDRLQQRPPLDEAELLARQATAPSQADTTEAELIAAALQHPHDDAPRQVYADWLSERAEPRGELMTLQAKEAKVGLKGKDRKRITKLVADHGSSWIFPLDAVVREPRFRLGFLSGCGAVDFRTDKQRQTLVDHPLWATVESIDDCNCEELLQGDALRSLKTLAAPVQTLLTLAQRATPLPVQTLEACFFDHALFTSIRESWEYPDEAETLDEQYGTEAWRALGELRALSNVRRLRVRPHADWPFAAGFGIRADRFAWLRSLPLVQQLEHLMLMRPQGAFELQGWLDGGLAALPKLRTLELAVSSDFVITGHRMSGRAPVRADYDATLRARRDDEGAWALELDIGWPYAKGRAFAFAEFTRVAFAGFPHAKYPELKVRYVGKRKRAGDLVRLSSDLGAALLPLFRRVHLPDGRVVAGS